jgi:hypothetical protein
MTGANATLLTGISTINIVSVSNARTSDAAAPIRVLRWSGGEDIVSGEKNKKGAVLKVP